MLVRFNDSLFQPQCSIWICHILWCFLRIFSFIPRQNKSPDLFFLMSTIIKMRHYICPVVCHSSCHGLLPHVEWWSSSRNVLFFSLPSVPSICLLERSCIAIHTLRQQSMTRIVTYNCTYIVTHLTYCRHEKKVDQVIYSV